MACRFGNLIVLELLLKNGDNIESKDVYGCTPLHISSMSGRLKFVELLVKKGVNIDPKDNRGRTPLQMACRFGNLDIFKFLLENGANIYSKDNRGRTPLEMAPNLEVVKLMKKYYMFSTRIQYFFRVIVAKILANKLRLEPRNLFDPEFSVKRKFLLKIDDSRFV